MIKAYLLLFIIFMAGCSSTSSKPLSKYYTLKNKVSNINSLSTEERQNLDSAVSDGYFSALEVCSKTMSEMRGDVKGSSKISTSIAVVGIVAGSVVVPALAAKATASKAAIAAWGGISGAANAGQSMLDDNGMSPFQASAVYEQMRTEVKAAVDAYAVADSTDKRAIAINKLTIACEFQPLPAVKQPGT